MRKYYVYELIDPRTNKPFYVGKGHGSRMYSHVAESKRPKHKWSNILKCERIQSIIRDNYTPEYNVVSRGIDENVAFLKEAQLLQQYGRIIDGSGILTNIRISHYVTHKNIPERKYKSYSIVQYTLDGQKLNTFPSSISAADCLKKNKTGILQTCHKKRHSAYGYVWRFENDAFSPPPTENVYHTSRRRPVKQILNGKVIATFPSLKEAAAVTGVNHSGICNCCNNKAKKSGGYVWEFVAK